MLKWLLLDITQTATITGEISAPNDYTKTQINERLSGKSSSSAITSAIAGKADTSTIFFSKKNDANNVLQQNTEGSLNIYSYTDPNNVYSGGVIPHQTRLILL